MDDLEKAILFSFDQTGAVDPQLKATAQAYCLEAKKSPSLWRMAMEHLLVTQFGEVQFWCLQALEEVVRSSPGPGTNGVPEPSGVMQLQPQDRGLLRQTLLSLYFCTGEQNGKRPEGAGSIESTGGGLPYPIVLKWPAFVRNKLAQIIVLLIRSDYPNSWSSPFTDILASLHQHLMRTMQRQQGRVPASKETNLEEAIAGAAVDMSCRIFSTLDEEVISQEFPRTPLESESATRIKDSMRLQCVPMLTQAWLELARLYSTVNPDVASAVLDMTRRFVPWIDITLVVTDAWLVFLFSLLSTSNGTAGVPSTNQGSHDESSARLRAAAAGCLAAIVTKRMEPVDKITLLQRMQMPQLCHNVAALAAAFKDDVCTAEEETAASQESILVTAVANELLECFRKLEDAAACVSAAAATAAKERPAGSSSAASSSSPSSSATTPATVAAAAASAQAMLAEVLPSVLALARHEAEGVSSPAFQFLLSYVAKLKADVSGKKKDASVPGLGPDGAKACAPSLLLDPTVRDLQLSEVMGILELRMRYTEEMTQDLDEPSRKGSEEEERMDEYRKDLLVLMRNIWRIEPAVVTGFVHGRMLACLLPSAAAAASFSQVEAVLSLFYQLGEGLLGSGDELQSSKVSQMLSLLLSAASASSSPPTNATSPRLPGASHRLISLLVLDTFVRYSRLVAELRPDHIPGALSCFLGPNGLRHPNPAVSARASYLFMRLVKALRQKLLPYADSVLQSLSDRLSVSVSPSASAASKPSPFGSKAETGADDSLYVFEAVGLLVGLDEVPVMKQMEYLSIVLVPICQQIDSLLTSSVAPGDMAGSTALTKAILPAIVALSYVSKGFSSASKKQDREDIAKMFSQACSTVLRVLHTLPNNRPLRSKVLSFLHRMLDVLHLSLLPVIPRALQQLLLVSEAQDLPELVQFLNQLASKFRSQAMPIIDPLLLPFTKLVLTLVPPEADSQAGAPGNTQQQQQQQQSTLTTSTSAPPASRAEELRERLEVQRVFVSFLLSLTSSDLTPVLVSPQNRAEGLTLVVTLLARICAGHPDLVLRKNCIQVFSSLISSWCHPTSQPEEVPGFRAFIMDRFVPECCLAPFLLLPHPTPPLDMSDANVHALLLDISSVLKLTLQRCGHHELTLHLSTVVLPSVRCPPSLAEPFCAQLQQCDAKAFRASLKTFILQVRAQSAMYQQQQQQQQQQLLMR